MMKKSHCLSKIHNFKLNKKLFRHEKEFLPLPSTFVKNVIKKEMKWVSLRRDMDIRDKWEKEYANLVAQW